MSDISIPVEFTSDEKGYYDMNIIVRRNRSSGDLGTASPELGTSLDDYSSLLHIPSRKDILTVLGCTP